MGKFIVHALAAVLLALVPSGAAWAACTPPTYEFLQPAANANFTAPANVHFKVQAYADCPASVSSVKFYNGTTLLAQVNNSGDGTDIFDFDWNGLGAGTYTLKVTSPTGASPKTTTFTVSPPSNQAPGVTMNAATGAPFVTPSTIGLSAGAWDNDGWITRVEFYQNGALIVSDTVAPYETSFTAYSAGTYNFSAVAFDNSGANTYSNTVGVNVIANNPPSVAVTSPANGASYLTPTTIPITASASDGEGWVTRVDFSANGVSLGSDYSAPYEAIWNTGTIGGSYPIVAVAYDDKGAQRTSIIDVSLSTPSGSINANPNPCTIMSGDSCNTTISWSSNDAGAKVVRQYDQYYQTQEGIDDRHVTQVVGTGASGSVVMDIGEPKRNQTFELRSGADTVITFIAPAVNRAPWTNISTPVADQVFHAPVNLDITAVGADADGTVTKVEFYANGSLLATDTSAPYAATWTNAPVGSHSLTTKAYDNLGATRVSAAIPVVVNALPTVVYTAPADSAVVTLGQTVTLSANASDSDGTIAQVDFLADGAVVATDTASPFSASWTPATAKTYALTARALDNRGGTTTTAPRSLIVNALPTVTLTAPTSGTLVHTPATLNLTANAADSDGTIARVDFYNGATLLGSDATSPYAYTWSNAPAGVHSLTATAVDNRNGAKQSAVATVTVNASPTVSLTAPVNNAVLAPGVYTTLTATASDSDGGISKVELLADGAVIATMTAAPFSTDWLPPTPKTYVLTAKAYDNRGAVTTSTATNLYVNVAPSVSLTSPDAGLLSSAPATIALSASAADSDGNVTQVEFFAGSTSVGTDTAAPYSLSWSSVGAGTYVLTARATDNRGVTTTSTPRTVVVAPQGAVIRRYVYDTAQQLCKTIEPETGATVNDYDAAGNVVWSAAGLSLPGATSCDTTTAYSSGRRVDRTYDARNRVSTLVFPDSNGNQIWSYTLDGLPAQVETFNEGGNSSVVNAYSYNRRRLLTAESQAQTGRSARTMGYGYDANGNLRTFVYPDGLTIDYSPNAMGQPTQAGTYASGISYYPNGALKQFTYGNGVVHTLTQNTRGLPDRSRDALGATSVLDDSYDYDQNGNVMAISDGLPGNRGNRDMTYDVMDRLASASSPMFGTNPLIQYEYNALDNLKRVNGQGQDRTYVYDAANRLTNVMVGSTTLVGLGYDEQGNLNNKSGQIFTFDKGNRLRTTGAIGAFVAENYRYDGHGRRVLATTNAGAIGSMYGQDGVLRYQEDARAGKFSAYVYLNGSLLATRSSTAFASGTFSTRYQHTDALGSPVAVTDESGVVTERSEYSPYGALLNRPISNGPGYTGHVMDAATGLTYMQQRYYDPLVGRFLSVDPIAVDIATASGFNRYWYANNSPYKFIDPDGRLSYLVSRPLDFPIVGLAANHNFIVHNAAAAGDPGAKVRSFGITSEGTVGEVTSKTEGPNASTSAMDQAAWESIGDEGSNVTFRLIEAPDEVVQENADSVSSAYGYSYVPEVAGQFNSNTVAGAVAQESDGGAPRVDNGKLQPGTEQERINSAREKLINK